MSTVLQLLFVAFLLAVNGWFAMSELAIVSSRRSRLEAMARDGDRGARRALALADDPGRFLSSVQIGITLVGVLAGAYSGATLAEPLARTLAGLGMSPAVAGPASIALVVGTVTYASLIVGELVPKRIALSDPERVAALVAGPMTFVSAAASPLVTVLDLSSGLILRLLRMDAPAPGTVTEEEIRAVIAEGTRSGILAPEERELMAGVMRFSDRGVRGVMTPRPDVVGLDLSWDRERVAAVIAEAGHSRYPVWRGGIDGTVGILQTRNLLGDALAGRPFDLEAAAEPFVAVPDTVSALDVLEVLRGGRGHMVLVLDEYGSVEGIVTAADVLEAISGIPGDGGGEDDGGLVRRTDGSWLVDADLPVDLVADRLDCPALAAAERDYETVAGFILHLSRSIPAAGDVLSWRGWSFEIVDMDGRRIDKVLVTRPPQETAEGR